jgi:hypothetical protein
LLIGIEIAPGGTNLALYRSFLLFAQSLPVLTQAVWKRLSSPQKLQRMGVVHVDVTV